jgi:hypothetical protein
VGPNISELGVQGLGITKVVWVEVCKPTHPQEKKICLHKSWGHHREKESGPVPGCLNHSRGNANKQVNKGGVGSVVAQPVFPAAQEAGAGG